MKKFVAAIAAIGVVSGTAQAADGDPQTYRPATSWAADYGDDYCRLARDFSNGNQTIALALERVQPTTLVKLMLVGDSIRLYRSATSIGYNYLPSGDSRQGVPVRSKATDGRQLLIFDGVNIGPDLAALFSGGFGGPGAGPGGGDASGAPAFEPGTPLYNAEIEAGFASGIQGIMLTAGTVNPVRLETGPMKAVIEALQACTYDLLSHWGLDGEKHRTISREVVPQSGTTLPQGTVGFQDFAKLSGGMNQIRLMIDASGNPTDCKIHSPSLGDATNKKICDHLTKNAKFSPALDGSGQPMASYWIQSVFFLFGPPGT